ncbi:TIGR02678 family protein [Anaerotalea alkaliphila]|uniref:TIGR02678 family protein n=1 Tax=Anaerotalea alkaliphila TaxID=2662126 RepID=A0A7X5HUH6_9FIRM|nr:TIGR02678 family protein [Anaerotalea alkaliphila]NDL66790.1 TIGR02678 family protein [Anaerotalea alkaliphila]
MQEIRELLNRRWVLKRKDPELYFRLKDAYGAYQSFFKDKLGYALILNPILVKAEKIPGRPSPWMGIGAFDTPLAYVFLCWLLMFLEEMEPEEQFVLAQVTDHLKSQPIGAEPVDWTVYSNRKTLIKVLHFLQEEEMILVSDGDDSQFAGSEEAVEVLYENTGASKYFMRRFPFDITGVKDPKAFETLDWQSEEGDRGLVRRHRVYRRLVMEPVVYQEGPEDQDYLYIKNQRGLIAGDLEKAVQAELHVHRNGALVLFPDQNSLTDTLPNRKNISDITLQTCREVRRKVEEGEWERDRTDVVVLSKVQWRAFLGQVRETYGEGWSKGYRELGESQLVAELTRYMEEFGLLQVDETHKEIRLLPGAAKLSGDYPKDYWQRGKDRT